MKNIFRGLNIASRNTASNGSGKQLTEMNANALLPVTPALRDELIGFVIGCLQPYVDEKGSSVAGIELYILCSDQGDEEAVKLALYADRPGLFKSKHLERALANHFIQLEPNWNFEYQLLQETQLPKDCIQKSRFGLRVRRPGDHLIATWATATLEALAGQTALTNYLLDPTVKTRFYIGRTSAPQLASGRIQYNDIVFLGSDEPGFDEQAGAPNTHVSRNHAYLVYDAGSNRWLLYPDHGGLPENGNKLKVHSADGKTRWLLVYGVSHQLCDGDQLELGGRAILRFSIVKEEADG